MSEAWSILSNFESTDLVKRSFKARHGRELNTSKAREICTSFTQARNYASSARGADRSVRPLLTYYSVLSLTRGLVLFLSKSLREAGLAQSHGLSATAWGAELNKEDGDIGALTITINAQGTFRELVTATGHYSFLRNNSSRSNVADAANEPPAEAKLILGDILARLPAIRATFFRWRDDRQSFGFRTEKKGDRTLITVEHPYTLEDARAVVGDIDELNSAESESSFFSPPDLTVPMLSDFVAHWNVGSLVAMNSYPGDVRLSKLTTAFAAAYAMGMLVRYFPSHWVSILHNVKHDAALPTLLAALAHVEEAYPEMVVEFLERDPASLAR